MQRTSKTVCDIRMRSNHFVGPENPLARNDRGDVAEMREQRALGDVLGERRAVQLGLHQVGCLPHQNLVEVAMQRWPRQNMTGFFKFLGMKAVAGVSQDVLANSPCSTLGIMSSLMPPLCTRAC